MLNSILVLITAMVFVFVYLRLIDRETFGFAIAFVYYLVWVRLSRSAMECIRLCRFLFL